MPFSHDSASSSPRENGHSHPVNGHANGHSDSSLHADDVGIVAMEVYFPSTYVEQSELEVFDGVSAGKYTVGHGQERMGFCLDREDVVSMCSTVLDRLMNRTGISYADVGRLDVGTETLIDKSKSIKTCLMRLFESEGNSDVEGVDNLNACYGGTAALFNCLDWVESSAWDGRYAVAIAGDIAVYESGNARCTGGAGAVAMLIGPNAGLVFDQGYHQKSAQLNHLELVQVTVRGAFLDAVCKIAGHLWTSRPPAIKSMRSGICDQDQKGVRATFMQHAYDFYKPDMASEYPTVDGPYSLRCYMEALDKCYGRFCHKFETRVLRTSKTQRKADLSHLDYVVFHSPFTKLVQKSLSRLLFHDFVRSSQPDFASQHAGLEKYRDMTLADSYADKDLEKLLLKLSQDVFLRKTATAQKVARNVGNMYSASLYGGLASLIAGTPLEDLVNKRVALFSYGSGVAASLFSARFVPSPSLTQLVDSMKTLFTRLDQRQKIAPERYDQILKHKEDQYNLAPFTPSSDIEHLDADVFYLTSIDKVHRRSYAKTESR